MARKRSANDRRKREERRRRKNRGRKEGDSTAPPGTPAGPLPKSLNHWEGARGSAGVTLADGAFKPVDWVVWIEQPMGLIVGHAIVGADDELAMATTLARALVAPEVGAPRRPRAVRVATTAMSRGLHEALGGVVPVEVAPTPRAEALGRSLSARLERDEACGYLDLHTVEADVLADLFEAMSGLAGEEAVLSVCGPLRLDVPSLGVAGAIGCLMQFGADGSGLLIQPSAEHYRAMAQATDERPPADLSCIVVLLVRWKDLPKRARQDVEKHGWRRAADGRCPLLVKRGPTGKEIPATAQDHLLATLFAQTLTDLAQKNPDDLRAPDRAIQCTIADERAGEIEVLYPGDLDEDELASIIESKTEATIFLPEAAYHAALGVDVLSPRARRVLERASPSNGEPGFELRAKLDDFDHVGRLLMTVSTQPGRPAALEDAAFRMLLASEPPPPLAASRPAPKPGRRGRPARRPRAAAIPGAQSKPARRKRVLYQLRIELQGIRPPIWRQLEVRSDLSFADLHRAIQGAMGWEDCHLHAFECDDRRFGPRNADLDAFDEGLENERTVRLDEVLTESGDTLLYRYDFGDDWLHEVSLEAIRPLPPGGRAPRPRCIGGGRACPPEDCGGPFGYAEMLKALKNPRHPEHAHYREWLGGSFDPEAF